MSWPVSSAGQSVVLITPRSWVQAPYWPLGFLNVIMSYHDNYNNMVV